MCKVKAKKKAKQKAQSKGAVFDTSVKTVRDDGREGTGVSVGGESGLREGYAPYVQRLLERASAEADVPFLKYTGESPLLESAKAGIANLTTPAQFLQGTNLAQAAGIGALDYGQYKPTAFTTGTFANPVQTETTVPKAHGGEIEGYDAGGTVDVGGNPATNPYTVPANPNIQPVNYGGQNVTNVQASYMSPYMQNVVDVQKAKAAKEYQAANQKRAQSAISAGAFGGSRSGVQQAIAENDLLSRNNEIQALGLQSAFDAATGLFEKDRAAKAGYDTSRAADLRSVQSNQAAENINNRNFGYDVFRGNQDATSKYDTSQAGENDINRKFGYNVFNDNRNAQTDFQKMLADEKARVQNSQSAENRLSDTFNLGALKDKSGIAGNIADLSERARNGDIQAAQLLGALGSDQEADIQKGLDLEYQNFLDQRNNPRQQLNDYAAILRGLPIANIGTTSGSETGTSTAAQPSGLQQLLGAGTSALGLYKGLIG